MGWEGDGGTGSDGGAVREQRGGRVGEGGGSLGEGKRKKVWKCVMLEGGA